MNTTILYLVPGGGGESGRTKLSAFSRHAATRGWSVKTVDARPPSIARLVEFWSAAGCVCDCLGEKPLFQPRAFGRTPVVYLDAPADTLPPDTPNVMHDSAMSARLAAKELIGLGYPHYAFVPFIRETSWSDIRERTFSEALALNGYKFTRFPRGPQDAARSTSCSHRLTEWIRALPAPCALFAANDVMGKEAVLAARRVGKRVPEDLAVASIDNNPLLVDSVSPALTSVQVDFESAGRLAGMILEGLIKDPRAPFRHATFGPLAVYRRGSTTQLRKADAAVAHALDFIRKEYVMGITAADVARRFPNSRRSLEMRFLAATGKTILETILECRMERLFALLRQPQISLDVMAGLTGWKSNAVLRRHFKAAVGVPPGVWRQRHQRTQT